MKMKIQAAKDTHAYDNSIKVMVMTDGRIWQMVERCKMQDGNGNGNSEWKMTGLSLTLGRVRIQDLRLFWFHWFGFGLGLGCWLEL
jgi:hypothetical protein